MKILVIQTAFLGDAFLTLPLIQKIKERFPESFVDVVAIPSTQQVFSASPFVNEVYVFDKKGNEKSLKKTVRFALTLKKNNYEKIFSPHRSFRTSLIVKLINAPEKTGFENASWSSVYNKIVRYNKDAHEVARNLSLLDEEFLKGEDWKIPPEIETGKDIEEKLLHLFPQIKKGKFVAVAPGSVWETKKYPAQYYIEIIDYLIGEGYSVFLIGGKEDKQYCEDFAKLSPKVINAAGMLSPVESVALLRRCEFLISNDSAPAHMGQAAGIKTLMLYTSTVPSFGFYPYLEGSSYLSYDNLACKPCGIHGKNKCPVKTFDCGFLLKPETVIEKLKLEFITSTKS